MKVLNKVGFMAILFAMGTACSSQSNDIDAAENPSNRFALKPSELTVFKQAAKNGSLSAMTKLADYYLLFKDDEKQGIYWLEQAGNAGDLNARKSVIEYYEKVPQGADEKEYAVELRKKWNM